jgi:excisionase family DNA binding protein
MVNCKRDKALDGSGRISPSRLEVESMEPILIRVEEAAAAIGISRATAYDLIAKGEIPSVRLGVRNVRVPIDGLKELIARRQERAVAAAAR